MQLQEQLAGHGWLLSSHLLLPLLLSKSKKLKSSRCFLVVIFLLQTTNEIVARVPVIPG